MYILYSKSIRKTILESGKLDLHLQASLNLQQRCNEVFDRPLFLV